MAGATSRLAMPRRAITMSYMAAEYRYTKPSNPKYLGSSGADVAGGV